MSAQQVQTREEQAAVIAPQGGDSAIINMIERLATNPAVDVDKLFRLMEMRQQIEARAAETAFNGALAAMQTDLPIIDEKGGIKDRNGSVQSTYARWDDINEAIKPVLTRFGFALSFRIGRADDGRPTVTGVLRHAAGHKDETTIVLPVDSSGSKNDVQAVGSSTSYGQRYTARALLNLTSRKGEDDDGQKAGAGVTITQEQADELQAVMEGVGADKGRFLIYMKVGRIADIPAGRYAQALAALEAKRVRA